MRRERDVLIGVEFEKERERGGGELQMFYWWELDSQAVYHSTGTSKRILLLSFKLRPGNS